MKTRANTGMVRDRVSYLFYEMSGPTVSTREIPEGYRAEFWFPTLFRIAPPGTDPQARAGFIRRWFWHQLHVFSHREYCVFIVRKGETVAHFSSATPSYWRFRFMGRDDVQVGGTWTAPGHRGKGLAVFALQEISRTMYKPHRRFWYVVSEDNRPSIGVAERAGMQLFGKGTRVEPLGLKILASIRILTILQHRPAPALGKSLRGS